MKKSTLIGWFLIGMIALMFGCSAGQYACPVIDLADKTCENVIIKYDEDAGAGAQKAVSKDDLLKALQTMEEEKDTADAGATE